ncbi:Origin recognition complex subunit 3 [Gracilaria domingensis]|nr:Origin recognition complex subunit 3 [Gracilaria domingensis]
MTKRSRTNELVSAPTTVLCKRPKSRQTNRAPNPAQEAWKRFELSVQDELNSLYKGSLIKLVKVVNHFSKENEIVAACVVLGAAAAAGDREQAFQRVVKHLWAIENSNVISMTAAEHGNIAAMLRELESADFSKQTIVAVDDVDRLPESVIRDMVYKCGKMRESEEAELLAQKKIPPITLVLGVGVSDARFHSALGIAEAAIILPTIISMPTPAECFRHVVNAIQEAGLELSREVFDFLYREFVSQDRTISMVMRFLRLLFTLHFYREPLAAVFCQVLEERAAQSLEEGPSEGPEIKQHLFRLLRKEHLDVVEKKCIQDESHTNGLPIREANRNLCLKACQQLWVRRVRLETLQRLVIQLCRAYDITPRWEHVDDLHRRELMNDLRINVFRAFLVEDDAGEVKFDRFITPLFGMIRKAGKPLIRRTLKTIIQEISRSLEASNDEEMSSLMREAEKILKDLSSLSEEQSHPLQNRRKSQTTSSRYAKGGGAARNRRRQIITAVANEVQSSDPLVPVRKKLESVILRMSKLVKSLNEIPLYQTVLVSDIAELQSYCGGMGGPVEPRTSLFTAMRQPQKILGPSSASFHADTAVAYRILAEGGRLVGLYDWYNSFASVVIAAAARQDDGGNVQIAEVRPAELQSRFARACSELEVLGVMKYTNRKSDHVARLVFE